MSSPKITLLIVTDGRSDYLKRTLESAQDNLVYPWHEIVLMDDSGANRGGYDVIRLTEQLNPTCLNHSVKRGGAASIRTAWEYLRTTDCDYVFHLEDDWTFPEPVDVDALVRILQAEPHLAKITLRRQPCGNEGPGGYIGDNPDDYHGCPLGEPHLHNQRWFSLNPGLYPRAITEEDWPEHGHEHHFTGDLLGDGWEFAVYGKRDDPPRCHHIGEHRSIQWTW